MVAGGGTHLFHTWGRCRATELGRCCAPWRGFAVQAAELWIPRLCDQKKGK